MYTRQIVVCNPTGLHARPATQFVKCAAQFSSKITVKNVDSAGKPVNAKSMVLLLSQGLKQGDSCEIVAEGIDEQQAVDTLVKLIQSGFGET